MATAPAVLSTEYRAVIRFCVLLGKENKDICAELIQAYGENAPSESTVRRLAREFRHGRTNIADMPRSGRPRIEGLPEQVSALLLNQPFASTWDIADELGISHMTAYNVLVRDLHMHKFVSRWVPHELSERNKADRANLSKGLLAELRAGNIQDIITGDESWFYFDYSPDGCWARKATDVPTRVKRHIATPKSCSRFFGECAAFTSSKCSSWKEVQQHIFLHPPRQAFRTSQPAQQRPLDARNAVSLG